MHVLVAGKIRPEGLELLRAATGVTLDYVEEVSTASYLPLIGKADALLVRTQPVTAEAVAQAPRLKIVSRHGVGYDAVDVPALTARGIALAIVGDVNSISVAEQTVMLMLALAKKTVLHHLKTCGGDWNYRNRFDATELSGKTLLLAGFGRIGRGVAKRALAFDMRVLAHDPFVSEITMRDCGAEPAPDLMAALAAADVVSLHMPLAKGGPLIGDEAALAAALDAGRIAGAGLDVLGDEPPAAGHPLFGQDRVVLSPHIAGLTQEAAARMSQSSAQNILDFMAGRIDPALVVNAKDVGLPTRSG
jgi:D-3-phosphoglycerate dehydrogenase